MATSKDIHEFAIRWFEKYRSSSTKEHEVVEGFEDKVLSLMQKFIKTMEIRERVTNTDLRSK